MELRDGSRSSSNIGWVIEHPAYASSWKTQAAEWLEAQEGVIRFEFDQCMTGLKLTSKPSKKTTGILTNDPGVALHLSQKQCDHQHEHQHLLGGLPSKAQVYPPELVSLIAKGARWTLEQRTPRWSGIGEEEDDEDLEDALAREEQARERIEEPGRRLEVRDPPGGGGDEIETRHLAPGEDHGAPRDEGHVPLTDAQVKEIHRIHINTGHLPSRQMMILLKAAGAKRNVLRYVQDSFKCDQCGRQKNPVARKKVTFPRTFLFNYILGMDTFYVRYGSRHVPFINLVCHGTSYQMVIPILGGNNTPNSSEVWEIILRYWVRPFGFPEAVLTDGGPEFQGKVEQGFETYGVMLHIIDSNAPWQAGKVERRGMWVKQRLETEIAPGTSVVLNEKDLEELCTQLIAHKNQYFSRGGYSQAQLVFGKNVRVPDDLLSEDMQDIPGWEEPGMDPSNPASEASEFARTQAIRARARELAMKHISRERVLQAARAPEHQQREWFKGQVVYVWRRGQRAYPGHVKRSRWTGPGVVIMQSRWKL